MHGSIQHFLEEGILNLGKVCENFAKNPMNFAEFVEGVHRETNRLELDFIAEYLEERDKQIIEEGRRKEKWHVVRRDQKQLITSLGTVTYHKTLFKNKETGKSKYLLDEIVGIGKHERMSEDSISRALTEAVQSSYRKGGEEACINEEMVSKQTVKKLIHELKFPEEEKPSEKKKTEYLYIDADEDHLSLQFYKRKGDLEHKQGRKTNTLLSKLVYIYEGMEPEAPKSKRWRLKNPHYISGVYSGEDNKKLWKEVADYIESHYDMDYIKRIYLNGDGANWIKRGREYLDKVIVVLDEFHIKQCLVRMTGFLEECAEDARGELLETIRNGKKDDFKGYCEKLRKYAETEGDIKRIDEGEKYIISNWGGAKERLKDRRNVKGCSAEAHVEHVLSRRMSSDPMGWSQKGADQMSRLRAYYLNGGNILKLVRGQKNYELKKASGAEGQPILSCSKIIQSERSKIHDSLRYVERMQASISFQTREKIYFRQHIRI